MADFPTVLLTGTIGSGKTAVATELGHLLEERGVPAALIDLDWLNWLHGLDSEGLDALMAQNLAALWPNFLAAGARAFVLTRAVVRERTLMGLRNAIPGATLTVVRLIVPQSLTEERLRQRDAGTELDQHLSQSRKLAEAMDKAGLEDATVKNDGSPIRTVAEDVLRAWQLHRDIAKPS